MATTIRIAMFNADVPVPAVRPKHPSYGGVFHNLLSRSASRITAGAVALRSDEFDVVNGEYPSCPADYDAIVISGAAASSYDDVDWAKKLDAYVKMIWDEYPQVKMFGSCFGHQILCQSLLRDAGVTVQKDPNGYELGVQEIRLTDAFIKDLVGQRVSGGSFPGFTLPLTPSEDGPATFTNNNPSTNTMSLQMIHADHVVLPPSKALPDGWHNIGSSDHCEVQGLYHTDRLLTYQGHFEFDRFINTETLKVFGAKWDTERLNKGLESMDHDDDSLMGADCVLRFLMSGKEIITTGNGGLVTPPVQA